MQIPYRTYFDTYTCLSENMFHSKKWRGYARIFFQIGKYSLVEFPGISVPSKTE